MPDRRPVDDLSIEELEAALRRRKREAQEERLRRLRASGRARSDVPLPALDARPGLPGDDDLPPPSAKRVWFERLLLGVELIALAGFLFVVYLGVESVRESNVVTGTPIAGLPSPTAPALIDVVLLPSGHTPPNAAGESSPQEAGGIPDHLEHVVAALTPPPIPTSGPEQPRLIEIPAINVRSGIVQGDGWEQLKLGVGQHIGSANPGQRGNLVLSGHNDVYGEVFRYLYKLKPGDLIHVETDTTRFTYKVAFEPRVVAPTEVSVLQPTRDATLTLITCHPYLIDTQRLIIVATLQ